MIDFVGVDQRGYDIEQVWTSHLPSGATLMLCYLPDCTDFFFFAKSAHLCKFTCSDSQLAQALKAKSDQKWCQKLFVPARKLLASLRIEPREEFLQQIIRMVAFTFPWVSTHLNCEVDLWFLCYRVAKCETQRTAQYLGSMNRFHFGHACMSCSPRPTRVRRR